MRKFILLALFTIIFIGSYSQNSFYDSRKITRVLKSNKLDSATAVAINTLFSYFVSGDSIEYTRYNAIVPQKLRSKILSLLLGAYDTKKICSFVSAVRDRTNPFISPATGLCDSVRKYNDLIYSIRADSGLEVALKQYDSARLKIQFDSAVYRLRAFTDSAITDPVRWNSLVSQQQAIRDTADSTLHRVARLKATIARNNADLKTFGDSLAAKARQLQKRFETIVMNYRGADTSLLRQEFGNASSYLDTMRQAIRTSQSIYPQGVGQSTAPVVQVLNETASLTNFRIPSQTEMIDALAIYMARRFKQEIALTLFNELVKVINKKELLRDLFPETLKLLNNTSQFEIPRFGSMWNHAISEDLVKFPDHLKSSTYLQNKVFTGPARDKYPLFCDIVTVSNLVIQKNSLPEIVSLYKSDTSMIVAKPIKQCFEIMNIVNNELVSTDLSKYWIGWNEFTSLSADEFEVMLGLWEARYEPVFKMLKINKPSSWITAERVKKAESFRNYFVKLLVTLNNLQNTQKQYLNRLDKDPNAVYTGTSFWDYTTSIITLLMNKEIIALPPRMDSTLSFINSSISIYKLLEEKKYAAMVHEAVNLLEYFAPEKASRINDLLVKDWKAEKIKYQAIYEGFRVKIDTLKQLFMADVESLSGLYPYSDIRRIGKDSITNTIKRTASYQYFDAIRNNYNKNWLLLFKNRQSKRLLVIKKMDRFVDLVYKILSDSLRNVAIQSTVNSGSKYQYIIKTAEFLTDAMSSSNSKDLANVIDAYSMPPNSYKIKRASRFSIDLNAYIGVYGGSELIQQKGSKLSQTIHEGKFVYGISAPLGLSLSWGHRKEVNAPLKNSYLTKKAKLVASSNNCFTLSFTIIDIAAVLSYRVENGENAALPREVKWSQVFSPGLHLRDGIRRTPLCFSAGIQYTPQLRNLEATDLEQHAWRAYAGVFFDLPLFNLYHR